MRASSRFLPRFSLLSLLAAMLLAVSFAGWWRFGRPVNGSAAECEALALLIVEGCGYDEVRRFPDSDRGWDDGPRPVSRFTNLFVGDANPLVALTIRGAPSQETCRRLFELPHLERLTIDGFDMYADGKSYVQPSLEATYGGSLPDLPESVDIPEEPPTIPAGTKLSAEERDEALHAIEALRDRLTTADGERFLWRSVEGESNGETLVAVDSDRVWHENWSNPTDGVSTLTVVHGNAWSRRYWNKGEWNVSRAARDGGAAEAVAMRNHVPDAWNLGNEARLETLIVGDLHASIVGDVEELPDGSLILRLVPRKLAYEEFGMARTCRLLEGAVLVGPEPERLVLCVETRTSGEIGHGDPSRRWDAIEYGDVDGRTLPIRRFTWTRDTPPMAPDFRVPDAESRFEVCYAWDFDPDLPKDLFDLDRDGIPFFAAPPEPRFSWWYATAGLSVATFAFIGGRRVWRRSRRHGNRYQD